MAPPPAEIEHEPDGTSEIVIAPRRTGPSLIGGTMAVLSLVLICAPFVGCVVGILALIMNYRVGGWAKVCSIIGAVVNTLMTVLVIVIMVAR